MEQKLIDEMIDLAIAQLKYSYTPYSGFKVGAALLKMPLIPPPTVRSGLHSSRRSVKGRGIFAPFVLLEGRMGY